MEDSVEISAAVFLGMEGIPDIREAVPTKKNVSASKLGILSYSYE